MTGRKTNPVEKIFMVLIVYFFKFILTSHFKEPLELLYLGGAILSISACTFFLRKIEE